MEWIWVVVITALLSFFFLAVYRLAYVRGFKNGATKVLNEWKQYINDGGMDNE